MYEQTGLLPMATVLALWRAHLQHQAGELTETELRDAVQMELAAHEDLQLVIAAQALLGAATLATLLPEGVTADAYLRGLERKIHEDTEQGEL